MLFFHLFGQKRRRNGYRLLLGSVWLGALVLGQKPHRAGHIPRRDDGADAEQHPLGPLAGQQGFLRLALAGVGLATVHQPFHRLTDAAVDEIPPPGTGRREDAVPVADEGCQCETLAQRIDVLGRHAAQLPHRRILFEDDFSLAGRENFQRVAPADALGAADLLRDDHPPQLVPLCQVGAKKFFKFFKKPTKTDG